jgi:magnesium chelatase subunit D
LTAYPFAAIVGMEDLKLALLLNAVSPGIGGVLVRGEKGTAKSTVVRGLAELLPPIEVAEGCRFACDPHAPDPTCPDFPHNDGFSARPVTLAELPVGATEDRLTGSLDIEQVLARGVTAFQPGLLAAANRGILYVDEVNLLHDHLVDLLLDAAALGVSYVEREGVSVRHSARFLLVGTMNPEEGELRPQLLDRFGLTVEVTASREPAQRTEVVRRRLAFDADPAGFAAGYDAATQALAARVAAARSRLGAVRLPDAMLELICGVCASFGVDGMRADLVVARTAIALAAWSSRDEVAPEDVRAAARLALPHRRRRDPFDAPGLDEKALDEVLESLGAGSASGSSDGDSGGGAPDGPESGSRDAGSPESGSPNGGPDDDGPGGPGGAGPEHPDGGGPDGPDGGGPESPDGSDGGGPDGGGPGGGGARPNAAPNGPSSDGQSTRPNGNTSHTSPSEPVQEPAAPFRARLLTVPGVGAGAPGRRSLARGSHGRTVAARAPVGPPGPLHLPATLRAAALRGASFGVDAAATTLFPGECGIHQERAPRAPGEETPRGEAPGSPRWPIAGPATPTMGPRGDGLPARESEPPGGAAGGRVRIGAGDLREKVREGREGNLVLFVVDASGSMAARQRMRAVKGAVLSLLLDAYQRRDKVGLITFRGKNAELVLPPTSSVEAGARRLTDLRTGGRTPLAKGLALAARVLAAERIRDPQRRPLLVVVTDGRATVGTDAELAQAAKQLIGTTAIVVDCESGPIRLGLAAERAGQLRGEVIRLGDLAAGESRAPQSRAPQSRAPQSRAGGSRAGELHGGEIQASELKNVVTRARRRAA